MLVPKPLFFSEDTYNFKLKGFLSLRDYILASIEFFKDYKIFLSSWIRYGSAIYMNS